MAISSYLKRCGYQQNELKNVLYLIPKTATKKVHIDGDEAYVEYSGDTLNIIKIKGNNLAFQEDTSFDDRFRFDKTITLTVDGYITFKDFYSKYYAIVEDKSGTFWMVNADFPSYITYTYTLNDSENKTDLVFYAASNIPTIKLANFNPDNAEECETYMPYGIENLKLLEKNKSKLSTYNKTVSTHDDFKYVEAIDGTYELTEEFNGETYSTQLSFSIPLSVYKASWHVKLLEFEKNKYCGYLILKNSDYKAFLGYNTGLFPSYVINGDIVTITLTESSNYGMIFGDEYAVINTDLPNSIEFSGATCKNYNFESTCDWNVENKPNYITISPMSGNADTQYTLQVCNTDAETGYAVSEFVIRSCNAALKTEVIIKNPIYRWINTQETICVPTTDESWVESGTTCTGSHGVDKYVNSVKIITYDGGVTWYNTGIESASTLIEANSPDCGYSERWVESSTTCVGYDKHIISYKQISYDYGSTWTTPQPIQTAETIEEKSIDCGYSGYDKVYFTTIAQSNDNNAIRFTPNNDNKLSYSLDNGDTWIVSNVTPNLPKGTRVLWKGNCTLNPASYAGIGTFNGVNQTYFDVEGNVMSLLYGDDFYGKYSLSGMNYVFQNLFLNSRVVNAKNLVLPANILSEYCYTNMFYYCSYLESTPILSATTLASGCYQGMFVACISLANMPELSATTLALGCYAGMFKNCRFTAVNKLSATTLANNCYSNMFYECENLIDVPSDMLPATTLAAGCYREMFYGCVKLRKSPILPAETLVHSCYTGMFYGCERLNEITCLALDISADYCTQVWVKGVGVSGTFNKPQAATNWNYCDRTYYNGIPCGWTSQNYSS